MVRKRLSGPNPAFLEAAGGGPALTRISAPPIAGVAGDSAASAAFEAVAAELTAAREEGRLLQAVPLDQIRVSALIRDRVHVDPEALDELQNSLRAHGQRTPIEVMAGKTEGAFDLISGLRRVLALKALYAETGEARFGTVLAQVRHPESAAEAYVAMIEENEIRAGLSFYERARLVVDATRAGVFATEKAARLALFANVSRSKRSKIASFGEIHHALGAGLQHGWAIPERLGLRLAAALKGGDGFAAGLLAALEARSGAAEAETGPEGELALIEAQLARYEAGGGPKDGLQKDEPQTNGPQTDGPQTDGGEENVSRAKQPAGEAAVAVHFETGAKGGRLLLEGPGVDAALVRRVRALLGG